MANAGVAGCLVGLEIEANEERVVVEHLLEVRHQPVRIDRVAVEAATDLVVDAARRHAPERRRHHVEEPVLAGHVPGAEEEREHHRVWKLGRPADAPVLLVVVAGERARGVQGQIRRELGRGGVRLLALLETAQDLRDAVPHLVRLRTIGLRDPEQHAREARHAVAIDGRKYVPPKKGSPAGVRKTVSGQPP